VVTPKQNRRSDGRVLLTMQILYYVRVNGQTTNNNEQVFTS